MQLRVKLEQYTRTIDGPLGTHREVAMARLLGRRDMVSYTIGAIGNNAYSGWVGGHDDKVIYAYTLHKKRGRVINSPIKRRGRMVVEKRWTPTTWTLTVTIIPLALFALLPPNSKFVQHKHHWTLTTKG